MEVMRNGYKTIKTGCAEAHPVFIRNEILMQYDNVHKSELYATALLVMHVWSTVVIVTATE